MASMANLDIMMNATDNASPVIAQVNQSLMQTSQTANNTAPSFNNMNSELNQSKMIFRELAMGTMFLGASMTSMGIMFERSSNAMGQAAGKTLLISGAMLEGIASASRFIRAIDLTTQAIQRMTSAEILANAFSIQGLLTLALGGAVAVGTVASINAMNKSQAKVTNVNVHVAGHVTTDKQLAQVVRQNIVIAQQQNNTSGIR